MKKYVFFLLAVFSFISLPAQTNVPAAAKIDTGWVLNEKTNAMERIVSVTKHDVIERLRFGSIDPKIFLAGQIQELADGKTVTVTEVVTNTYLYEIWPRISSGAVNWQKKFRVIDGNVTQISRATLFFGDAESRDFTTRIFLYGVGAALILTFIVLSTLRWSRKFEIGILFTQNLLTGLVLAGFISLYAGAFKGLLLGSILTGTLSARTFYKGILNTRIYKDKSLNVICMFTGGLAGFVAGGFIGVVVGSLSEVGKIFHIGLRDYLAAVYYVLFCAAVCAAGLGIIRLVQSEMPTRSARL